MMNAKQLLAIEGGTPVRNTPMASWPHFDEDMIQAVEQVLRSGNANYWTGNEVKQFEQAYAEYTGQPYAIAVANGTLALELALYALNMGSGDEVIVPCRTFIATASSVVMRGATPVVVDIDSLSQNLTAETIKPAITKNTKAIIVVHLMGRPCEMDPILALAQEHGLKVIEDCAQAHGAQYRGKPVGSFGDIAAFSFCQDKIISTGGEGGMIVTADEALMERAWAFKDHGKSYQAVHHQHHAPGFRWLHHSFGSNWRLTEMQAAIGNIALRQLDTWVEQRRQHAATLIEQLANTPALSIAIPSEHIKHAYYKFYMTVDPEQLKPGWDRDQVVAAICAEGIPCQQGICGEIYRERAFKDTGLAPSQRFPNAQYLFDNTFLVLLHPTLNETDIHDTATAIQKVMEAVTYKS